MPSRTAEPTYLFGALVVVVKARGPTYLDPDGATGEHGVYMAPLYPGMYPGRSRNPPEPSTVELTCRLNMIPSREILDLASCRAKIVARSVSAHFGFGGAASSLQGVSTGV